MLEYRGSAGVLERGEHARVIYVYLGGLTDSAIAVGTNKVL